MVRNLASLSLLLTFALVACSDDDPTADSGETEATEEATSEDPATGDGDGDPSTTTGDGDGDPTTTGDGDGDATTTGEDPCEIVPVSPDEVVMIGDSYLAITSVPSAVFNLARLYDALGDNEEYRRYDQGGTQMGNGQIPNQFQDALAEDPNINTVIMTGGGNDVLIGDANDCLQNPPPGDQNCVDNINDVMVAAEGLLQDMADAGVQNVVYFFYPHLPDQGFVQGAKNETLDYAYPLVEELCANAPLNCVFVDTRPAFEGHQDEYFQFDGIHPNDQGSLEIANAVWSQMVVNCIAQEAA